MSHATAPLFSQTAPDFSSDGSPDPTPHASPNRTPVGAAPDGWVIAHCDGGARGNPGPAGYGAVLQDESGSVLAELSVFLGNRTNNFAEYSGLLGCLQWALDHRYRRLRVVSDSELMVKQIQGHYKVKSPDLRPLWQEARRRIAQLDRFEISHALRHKNKHADRLANDAMDHGGKNPATSGPQTGMRAGQTHPSRAPESKRLPNPAVSAPTLSGPARSLGAPEPANPAAPTSSSHLPSSQSSMLRGFTRNGAIHLLGGRTLPDGIFVKIIPEDAL